MPRQGNGGTSTGALTDHSPAWTSPTACHPIAWQALDFSDELAGPNRAVRSSPRLAVAILEDASLESGAPSCWSALEPWGASVHSAVDGCTVVTRRMIEPRRIPTRSVRALHRRASSPANRGNPPRIEVDARVF